MQNIVAFFIQVGTLIHECYLGADILGEVLEQELILLAEALLSHSHRDVHEHKQRREVHRLGRGQVEYAGCLIQISETADATGPATSLQHATNILIS